MDLFDWLVETGATYVLGVPTHAMDVLAHMNARDAKRIGNVKTFYMAGAPIPPSVAEAFVRLGIRPQNVYGMTENSSHQYTQCDDDFETIVRTCGRGGKAYEVRIFDVSDPDVEAAAGMFALTSNQPSRNVPPRAISAILITLSAVSTA